MKIDVNEITIEDFRVALDAVLNGEVTNIAPLGFSGDNLFLYHNKTDGVSHSGCVKVRTWSDMPELLIGNKSGRWLCQMKIDRLMGFEYILNEFHRQFENVKHLIDGFERDENEVRVSEHAKYSAGFKILAVARSAIAPTETA